MGQTRPSMDEQMNQDKVGVQRGEAHCLVKSAMLKMLKTAALPGTRMKQVRVPGFLQVDSVQDYFY